MSHAHSEATSKRHKSVFQVEHDKWHEAGASLATYSLPTNSFKETGSATRKTMVGVGTRLSYQHMALESLKKRASQDTQEETWSVYRTRLLYIFDSTWYSVAMGMVILANTVLVIHEVDSLASGVPDWITLASGIFLTIYFLEIVLRFYVFRLSFFQNAWNLIDLSVVITDICAEFAGMGGLNDLPSLSVLRIFRLVRLVRLIAMLSVFPELQTMLIGFGSAMKAMIWASLMVGVVITACSICAVIIIHPLNLKVAETGVYKDCERCGRAFETVAEANLTFIQQIIAGDSWGQITVPIIQAYPWAGAFFLLVFAVIDLGVINLVLMVIVNAAETAREANQDMQLRKKIHQIEESKYKLKHLCKELDSNDDGRISLDEFMEGLDENEEFCKAMAGLDVQRQDAEIIFHLMDEDKSGDVDFHEFVGTLVATNHESLTTKLLFLKASIVQIYEDLTLQGKALEEDVIPMVEAQQVAEVVKTVKDEVVEVAKTINDESSSKMALQCTEIMSVMRECQRLTNKLDQRWEQLQVEQAKTSQMLERVVDDMLLPSQSCELHQLQSEAQSSACEPMLPNRSLPQAGTSSTVGQPNGSRCCSHLCNPSEPLALRRLPISPAGQDMVGNDHPQRGLVVAQSVLSGSVNHNKHKKQLK